MNYPQIAAAELLETHADRLFLYCWSMLRSRETAQIALRDTLLAASADASGSRLYSLARAECGRHPAVTAADADEAPVCLGRNDAGNRLVAWNAAMSLEPAEFEALELHARHEVDPGQVLGLPAGPAESVTPASPGTLQLSAGSVKVGTGRVGQITLTAIGGPVRWSASSSAPNQVSLSSTAGNLAAGQSVTLTVTVTRGTPAGSATLSFGSPASASQLVLLTWSAPSGGVGSRPTRRPRPHPSPSASPAVPSPSPSPPSASPSDTTTPDPSGS